MCNSIDLMPLFGVDVSVRGVDDMAVCFFRHEGVDLVFKSHDKNGMDAARAAALQPVLEAAIDAGMHPLLFKDHEETYITTWEGKQWSLGMQQVGEEPSVEDAGDVGKALFGLHYALRSVEPVRLDNHFETDTGSLSSQAEHFGYAEHVETALRGAKTAFGELQQYTHGDPHLGNMLKTPGGRMVFIDFDSARTASVEADIALCAMRFPSDERKDFLEGYRGEYNRAELPFVGIFNVIQRLVFIHSMAELGNTDVLDDLENQQEYLQRCVRWAKAEHGSEA